MIFTRSSARIARLILPQHLHDELLTHLFPGDGAEHAAVIQCGWHRTSHGHRLLARHLIRAEEPRDYRVGARGFNALQPSFIHRSITACRDRRWVYLAVHNHDGRGRVAFSDVDLASHERGYPALRDIAAGMPVGALVVADGAMELDLWLPDGTRVALERVEVLGERRTVYTAGAELPSTLKDSAPTVHYARQELFLGYRGQDLLRSATIGVIGLGGVGSIVNELLSRLGVGRLILVDPDRIEASNFSRIVGATSQDVSHEISKVHIAERVSREANSTITITSLNEDFARRRIAHLFLECDYLFLAADTMRARLVFNAIVNQYYIPGVQMGTKITVDSEKGRILSADSFVRHVTLQRGCLYCNELIDLHRLADEWKSNAERDAQRYGTELPNPSVITMNAVAASYAVNQFLMFYLGLAHPVARAPYRRFDHLTGSVRETLPRHGDDCSECSSVAESRLGMGDAMGLPCSEG